MNLKELRKIKKISQDEVAKLLNVSQKTYCNYESGYTEPTIDTLCKLADMYQVSLDYLVGRKFGYELGTLDESTLSMIKMYQALTEVNKAKAVAFVSGLYTAQG